MVGMLEPTFEEEVIGLAEVRETFSVPKIGTIAGCSVLDGKILRTAKVRVLREGVVIYTGKIDSLRRFKDDVKEVLSGYECGIGVEKFNDIRIGDTLEAFVMKEIEATL
jgi:translation initiation factor IF-2